MQLTDTSSFFLPAMTYQCPALCIPTARLEDSHLTHSEMGGEGHVTLVYTCCIVNCVGRIDYETHEHPHILTKIITKMIA